MHVIVIEFLVKIMIKVITYGTFDLLHYGHLNFLKRAKELGDYLIVGVSSDDFCLEKGKHPVFTLEQRMSYISDLRYVDLTIPEYSMKQKIEDIYKYDVNVFVLGDDYVELFKQMPEYEFVMRKCKVIFLPRTPIISSSLLKNISDKEC